ncbi:LuxR C-terminal-related transcriptional regulator [Roseovarius arcticus]|uniref:LuxR C-terminal-related transcriptional regulator n=1 Tax=Roseovarius arcticus TaxID=2547404 RepID=UPI0011108E3D|nr:response regulator transcription factor [Roseovarius arcticus]
MQPITVAFVDDHPVLLSGICQLFSSSDEFRIVGVGSTANDVIEIAGSVTPDVIVIDLNMPGRVIEAIAKVANDYSKTKLIAFTASGNIDTAISTLEAGVLGYVLKGSTLSELTEAIRQVHNGETYMSPRVAANVVAGLQVNARARTAPTVRFSSREEDVLRFLLQGCTNKEIAHSLSLSEKTVKHYMTVLIQKLDVRNRVEVVLAAQELASAGGLSLTPSLN